MLVRLTDQQRVLLDKDDGFQAYLRQEALTAKTFFGVTNPATGNARPEEILNAMYEALRRQGDVSSAPPTLRAFLKKPEVPEPRSGHQHGQTGDGHQGDGGDQGVGGGLTTGFNPGAKEFKPSGGK